MAFIYNPTDIYFISFVMEPYVLSPIEAICSHKDHRLEVQKSFMPLATDVLPNVIMSMVTSIVNCLVNIFVYCRIKSQINKEWLGLFLCIILYS